MYITTEGIKSEQAVVRLFFSFPPSRRPFVLINQPLMKFCV